MKKIREKFEFHDGIVDLIKRLKDELIINFDLLNIKSSETEEIHLKFTECRNVSLNDIDLVDWKNSSASILTYEIFDNRLMFFLELTNYINHEVSYYEISFDYKELIKC